MKKILLALFLLSLSNPAWAYDWTQDANIAAAYLFADGSGTTLTDETGVNNGAFVNTPDWESVTGTNAPEYASGALNFNGTDEYINCGTDASLNFTHPSVVVWMYSMDAWGGENLETILSKQYGNTPYNDMDFREGGTPSTGTIEASITTNTSDRDECASTSLIPTQEWTHTAFTYDGTYIKVYVNGTSNSCTHSSGGDMVYQDAENLNIARNTHFSRNANVKLTELALFNSALDSTDINDIMTNGLLQTATATYYPFKQFNHGINVGVF
jgi:hypothetical protein